MLSAATVEIMGTAESQYFGKDIFVLKVVNEITQDKKVIASSFVNKVGQFHLHFDVDTTSNIVISIDRVNGGLFVEPNKTYNITFTNLPEETYRTFSNTNTIDLLLNEPAEDDINVLIAKYNLEFDNFLATHQEDFLTLYFKKELLKFRDDMLAKYGLVDKSFLNTYIHYSVANMALNTSFQKKNVFETFIKDRSIDVENPEGAIFFSQFFKNEIDNFDVYTRNKPLLTAIETIDIDAFLNQLERNPFLQNTKRREMVAALSLWQKYPERHAKKKNILVLLNSLSLQSTFPDVKRFCNELIQNINKLTPGTHAPSFQLYNETGNLEALGDFKNKFTLLFFWADWSSAAKNELQILASLLETYKTDIEVVTINVDDNPSKCKALAEGVFSKNENFHFLHYGHQKTMLYDYDVITIPRIVLLDKNGKIYQSAASMPSEQLYQELDRWVSAGR